MGFKLDWKIALLAIGGWLMVGCTTIHQVAFTGDTAALRIMLDKGENPNQPDQLGQTPLHHAVNGLNIPAAQLLLERGARVDATDRQGNTPLLLANTITNRGYPDFLPGLLQLLITNGANVNQRNDLGRTPLWLAATRTHAFESRLVETLLQAGADPRASDNSGVTPLMAAIAQFPDCKGMEDCLGNYTMVLYKLLEADPEAAATGEWLLKLATQRDLSPAMRGKFYDLVRGRTTKERWELFRNHCMQLLTDGYPVASFDCLVAMNDSAAVGDDPLLLGFFNRHFRRVHISGRIITPDFSRPLLLNLESLERNSVCARNYDVLKHTLDTLVPDHLPVTMEREHPLFGFPIELASDGSFNYVDLLYSRDGNWPQNQEFYRLGALSFMRDSRVSTTVSSSQAPYTEHRSQVITAPDLAVVTVARRSDAAGYDESTVTTYPLGKLHPPLELPYIPYYELPHETTQASYTSKTTTSTNYEVKTVSFTNYRHSTIHRTGLGSRNEASYFNLVQWIHHPVSLWFDWDHLDIAQVSYPEFSLEASAKEAATQLSYSRAEISCLNQRDAR